MKFEDVFARNPYSLSYEEKDKLLTERLLTLTTQHRNNCKQYNDILTSLGYDESAVHHCKDIPYLPVRIFKEINLKSIPDNQVVKTMTSSGTSGQKVSKIFLDRNTSSNQQKAMVKIVSSFTGSERMPMIIIDCPSVIKDRNMFSARGAGILGFSIFGTKKIYALKDDMSLDIEGILGFLDNHKDERILLFGFTFMIWQCFYKELERIKAQGITLDLSNAILIHGGGWKKLINDAVSPEEFRESLKRVCGIEKVHDYYGMVEQTGCIYMQCECGHLHASVFSDVIVRDPVDFSECCLGEKGIIQVVSSIPESYPGHSLLTEDEGIILGIDDCPCGRKGKYFQVVGRLKEAEIRGCSDTFASSFLNADKSESENMTYIIGDERTVLDSRKIRPLEPFSDKIIDFCSYFSDLLMKDKGARQYADVFSFGFWLRSASLIKMKEKHANNSGNYRIGRGVIFHIAPSNVAVNYAYSLFSGLLCGNVNIVRIPSRDFPQIKVINDLLAVALEHYTEIKPYINLVRYGRSKVINDMLSSLCDVRVIWGGDETISNLRESQLAPRASEVTFSDRYSLALIDSNAFLASMDNDRFIKTFIADFYNDTYISDQNACTSPRAIVWYGKNNERAKEAFWSELSKVADQKYDLQPIQSVDKYSEFCLAATDCSDHGPYLVCSKNNAIYRVAVKHLSPSLMEHRGNSGFFYEFDCEEISDLFEFCNDTRCQTLALFGNSNIVMPLISSGVRGVDRVKAVGHTMDFELTWDGYDLVERFTRSIAL